MNRTCLFKFLFVWSTSATIYNNRY